MAKIETKSYKYLSSSTILVYRAIPPVLPRATAISSLMQQNVKNGRSLTDLFCKLYPFLSSPLKVPLKGPKFQYSESTENSMRLFFSTHRRGPEIRK